MHINLLGKMHVKTPGNMLNNMLGNMLGNKVGNWVIGRARVPPDWSSKLGNIIGNIILAW